MVHVMHVHFMFFEVFKNLKSSYSEDNMPAPKLCIFLYNSMETTGVRQRMVIMHSSLMDTVFNSCDAWHPMP